MVKDTSLPMLGENGSLQIRAEFFNTPNTANFALSERFRSLSLRHYRTL